MAYFGAQSVESEMGDFWSLKRTLFPAREAASVDDLFNRAPKALARGVSRKAFQKPAVSSAQAVKPVRIRPHALVDTGYKAREL
ncbi:MAG: hypothetical protein OEU26_21170 [Candidatus Tectomicrobia bacterium]|nr:hypothetical protein [Candidatus Tectomicrobia bacterium]